MGGLVKRSKGWIYNPWGSMSYLAQGFPRVPKDPNFMVIGWSTSSRPIGMDIESKWKFKMIKRKFTSSLTHMDRHKEDISPNPRMKFYEETMVCSSNFGFQSIDTFEMDKQYIILGFHLPLLMNISLISCNFHGIMNLPILKNLMKGVL